MIEKIWIVAHKSNVDGDIVFTVTPCASEKTAQRLMQKKKEWLFNESIHYKDYDKDKEGFQVREDSHYFSIFDRWDDYEEEIRVVEKDVQF